VLIKKCTGYELEKEKPNTSEDFFNRSEVVFVDNGVEKTLRVLYVRYFDEKISEFTPYKSDPIFQAGSRDVTFKEIVALVCLIRNPGLKERKRVYINDLQEFASCFQDIDFAKLPEVIRAIDNNQGYELRSSMEFIVQP
jgi:hypothetical protein